MSLKTQTDQFLYRRFSADDPEKLKELETLAQKEGVNILQYESLLRSGYSNFPDVNPLRGKISRLSFTCDYTGLKIPYYLYVPPGYSPGNPSPLTLIAHGGNNAMSPDEALDTALDYIRAYSPIGVNGNHILAAPASSRGWGSVGVGNLFSLRSLLTRTFHIHPDKIHITGQSMGGHLAYRMALWFSDRFGAISPHSGGYDYVSQDIIVNLLDSKAYSVFGEYEPYGINEANKINEQWLKKQQTNWVFVEKKGGGHSIYPDEMNNIIRFFNQYPRNLYPPKVRMKIRGSMIFEGESHPNWGNEMIKPIQGRTFSSRSRYWLRIMKGIDMNQYMELSGEIRNGNIISVQQKNVSEFELWLHPKMVDWSQKVKVILNGKTIYEELPSENLKEMLTHVKEYDDRGRIFYQKLVFNA
ncbi:MAG: hypothetical protein K1X92_03980 [Bacteroidia bacterium]|nr:hypothetical protein [Bacteroidia bacterium]